MSSTIITMFTLLGVLLLLLPEVQPMPAAGRSVESQTLANLRDYRTHNTYSSGEEENDDAYSWGYQWTDEFGNQMFREEISDGQTVRGRYSYRESNGIIRIVEYISDENGFRTRIRTNEPGMVSSNPAGAEIIKFDDENNIPQ